MKKQPTYSSHASPPVDWSGTLPRFSLKEFGILLIIVVAALICYLPSIGGEFILNWDDGIYVVENVAAHGFSAANLKAAFSSIYVGNYAPLHIVSYMLDFTLWGLAPAGYHAVSIVLHAVNGALFYLLLRLMSMETRTALLAALLFVLHPVQVESVAWISQRKNLLCTTFSLASFILYIKSGNSGGRAKDYAASLSAFVLALLTKSAVVFMPAALILYDMLVGCRDRKTAIRSSVPFLLLSVVFCIITYMTQHEARTGWHGGSPSATLYTMLPVFAEYLRMLAYPAELSALYDPPLHYSPAEPAVAASFALFAAIFSVAAVMGRKFPREMFWFWFGVLAIAPVSQMVPLTTMMNDRYLYFPVMGFAALVSGFLAPLIVRNNTKSRMILGISILLLCILGVTSGLRALVWKDSYTLWSDAVRKSPGNRFARQGLAESLERRGDLEGASEQYLAALSKDPGSPELNSQAGVVFAQLRQFPRAIFFLAAAVNLKPDNDNYRSNLASALLESGAFDGAIEQLKVIDGRAPSTRNSCMLGALYEKSGDAAAASAHYARVSGVRNNDVPVECGGIRGVLGL